MTDTHTGLAAWLLAQIAEDEQRARLCAEVYPSPWEIADRGWRVRVYAENVERIDPEDGEISDYTPTVTEVEQEQPVVGGSTAEGMNRWLSDRVAHFLNQQPSKVLTDLAAKRQIVDECDRILASADLVYFDDGPFLARFTLVRLALPYADRPGYDEAWRSSR